MPLITYISSLLFTLFAQKAITQRFANRFIPMLISLFVTTLGALPFLFITEKTKWLVLLFAPAIGVGLALMLNTGTSLISDVLGNDVKSAAFVYGSYSLLDKFANGFLLYWLVAAFSSDANALPYIISLVPIFCAMGTTIVTYIGI